MARDEVEAASRSVMPLSRPVPVPKLPPRAKQKLHDRATEAKALKDCYKAVDARDGTHCRICGRFCYPQAIGLLSRAERHHMVYRSQGGKHETRNVLTVCKAICHPAIHVQAILRVSGDADLRDDTGKLCGVFVEHLKDGQWEAGVMR
jgi:ferredoxin